jgi:predicted small secreted protein
MKRKIKILIVLLILATGFVVSSCANMHWGANAGVDVRFGPNGPRLDPHVNLDLYSGGRM